MTQFTRNDSQGAGRISLARGRGPNYRGHPINTRQANHLATQLSDEAQGNMLNPLSMPLHTVNGTIEDIGLPLSSPHRSGYSICRFLDPCSEAPWTSEARREAHNKSRGIELSSLSSNLLAIIGPPGQVPPTDTPTATSDDKSNSATIWDSDIESNVLGLALWAPEILGRRENLTENRAVTTSCGLEPAQEQL